MADLDAEYRKILSEEYSRRSTAKPYYSQNAFARFLGIDHTYLSKLLSGKILLSLDVADKITKKLKLPTEIRTKFLMSAAEERSLKT